MEPERRVTVRMQASYSAKHERHHFPQIEQIRCLLDEWKWRAASHTKREDRRGDEGERFAVPYPAEVVWQAKISARRTHFPCACSRLASSFAGFRKCLTCVISLL
ncbi:MAG: hypothetical protein U0452_12030 [Anaerolineae bacterium]